MLGWHIHQHEFIILSLVSKQVCPCAQQRHNILQQRLSVPQLVAITARGARTGSVVRSAVAPAQWAVGVGANTAAPATAKPRDSVPHRGCLCGQPYQRMTGIVPEMLLGEGLKGGPDAVSRLSRSYSPKSAAYHACQSYSIVNDLRKPKSPMTAAIAAASAGIAPLTFWLVRSIAGAPSDACARCGSLAGDLGADLCASRRSCCASSRFAAICVHRLVVSG